MITCSFENGNVASPGLRHVTVNAIVVKGGQVLLGKRGLFNGKPISEFGKWALIGGFFDRNEHLVEAVKREVMEESGWGVTDLLLLRINDSPDRPMEDRQNVDMIFVAQAIKQIGRNDEEVTELKWFDLDALPPIDQIAFDHAEDLEIYRRYLVKPQQLPILG
ncbi:NUDIX hydrolase [Candidatus Woesebacteria bacterium]|nr:NUDIX hydrolase [Candidatus Woesebacteria bacterium]